MAKTEITPKQLFERRNTSDVFDRCVIVGLLRVLNNKLVYQQIWEDTEDGIENITVPFFYDFGGSNISSERFILDNYTFFTSSECTEIGLKKIDGNFDFYPLGRVSMSSSTIDSGNITNRFCRGKFTRRENGKLVAYTAYLYSLPITYQFDIEIRAENLNTAMKINQAFRETFYKNQTYRINYRGTICPVRVGFSENALQMLANGTYTFGQHPNENYHKLSIQLLVESYQPVFDRYSTMPLDAVARQFGVNIWVNRDLIERRTGPIEWLTDFEDMVLVCGQTIMVEWKYNYMDRDMLLVDLLYQEEGAADDELQLIGTVTNHNFFHWHIPEDFVKDTTRIDLIIPNADRVKVYTQPSVYIYADPDTKMVDTANVYVLSRGYFIVSDDLKNKNGQDPVDCILSYENKNGEIVEHDAKLNLRNYMIDEFDPMDFKCFVINSQTNKRNIRFILRDHNEHKNVCISPYITIV